MSKHWKFAADNVRCYSYSFLRPKQNGGFIMSVAETIRTSDVGEKLMSIEEARAVEMDHARDAHYYTVLMKSEVEQVLVRVRVCAYQLDENGHFKLVNGKRQIKNCIDVGLDVWAAWGADEYTLEMVQLAEVVMATPKSINDDLMLRSVGNMGA